MKIYIKACCAILLVFSKIFLYAQDKDVFIPLNPNDIKLEGYIGGKINKSITNGIAVQNVDYLIDPFKTKVETRLWQSEFWGKWFTSAADAYRYSLRKDIKKKLEEASLGLIATQLYDGYIGNYALESRLKEWDVWGRKYSMLGLLDYYFITKDIKTLQAIRKLANLTIREIYSSEGIEKLGNYKGMAASSILEPMVILFKITNDTTYLNFANYIVASFEKETGSKLISYALKGVPVWKRHTNFSEWFGHDNGQKAYEMMSCYEGLLELYTVTGKRDYFDAVLKAAEDIKSSEIMITGSGASMECWYHGAAQQTIPAKHMTETCVTVTWMKLCNRLLKMTGNPQWANEIEKSIYNSLFANMTSDGSSWSKYGNISGARTFGEDQCGMTTNCCIASGPRAIGIIPKLAVMEKKEGIVINLYSDMKAIMHSPSKNALNITMRTKYPMEGKIQVDVNPQRSEKFTISLRIPEWSKNTTVYVNSQKIQGVNAGAYLNVTRLWNKNDKIEILFDFEIREIRVPNDSLNFALAYGPLILAVDRRLSTEPFYNHFNLVRDSSNSINYKVSSSSIPDIDIVVKIPMAYEVNGEIYKNKDIELTNLSSAGNTWDQTSAYRLWFPRIMDKSSLETY